MSSALEEVLLAGSSVPWTKLGGRALCDACLGRVFGKAGHGLTNPERGRALREGYGIRASGPCWLCGGLLTEVEKFADLAAAKLEPWEFATFLVGSKVDPEVVAREESLWAELGTGHAEAIKSELNREIGKRLEQRLQRPAEFTRPDILAIVDTAFDSVSVTVKTGTPFFVPVMVIVLAPGRNVMPVHFAILMLLGVLVPMVTPLIESVTESQLE